MSHVYVIMYIFINLSIFLFFKYSFLNGVHLSVQVVCLSIIQLVIIIIRYTNLQDLNYNLI